MADCVTVSGRRLRGGFRLRVNQSARACGEAALEVSRRDGLVSIAAELRGEMPSRELAGETLAPFPGRRVTALTSARALPEHMAFVDPDR